MLFFSRGAKGQQVRRPAPVPTKKEIKPLVLVYLPDQPEQAMVALGLLTYWKEKLGNVEFDAICTPQNKFLARYCTSLRLTISFIQSDRPWQRDLQQGEQLSAMQYFCAIALSDTFHPQFTLKLSHAPWRIGWRSPFSWWLLTRSIRAWDWKGLWQQFSPQLAFPETPPAPAFRVDKAESHSGMVWLGLDKNNTILVACESPVMDGWRDLLIQLQKQGHKLLGCGNAVHTDWCDTRIPSVFDGQALRVMSSAKLVVGNRLAHQTLAKAFHVPYQSMDAPPPKVAHLLNQAI